MERNDEKMITCPWCGGVLVYDTWPKPLEGSCAYFRCLKCGRGYAPAEIGMIPQRMVTVIKKEGGNDA